MVPAAVLIPQVVLLVVVMAPQAVLFVAVMALQAVLPVAVTALVVHFLKKYVLMTNYS